MVLLSSFIFIPRIFLGECHIRINSWKVTWKIHFYKLSLVFPWPSLCYRSSFSGSIFLSHIIFKNSAKHTISHTGVCVWDGSQNKPQDTMAWRWELPGCSTRLLRPPWQSHTRRAAYTTEMYGLVLPEARGLRPRWWWGWFPLSALRKNLFHASLLDPGWFAGHLRPSLTCRCTFLISASCSNGILPMDVSVSVSKCPLFIETAVILD